MADSMYSDYGSYGGDMGGYGGGYGGGGYGYEPLQNYSTDTRSVPTDPFQYDPLYSSSYNANVPNVTSPSSIYADYAQGGNLGGYQQTFQTPYGKISIPIGQANTLGPPVAAQPIEGYPIGQALGQPIEGYTPADLAAQAYRDLPFSATSAERNRLMSDYANSITGRPVETEAEKLARYNDELRRQFIDPNSIGSAKLYTDPVTGQRKMEVPSIRQEEAVARELEQDKHYVNALKRADIEAAKGKGSAKPDQATYAAEQRLKQALGPTAGGDVASQRKRYLDAFLTAAKLNEQGGVSKRPRISDVIPTEEPKQSVYIPYDSARYGGSQKHASNGYQ